MSPSALGGRGEAVKLARKAAELLGLDPDKLWIVKFLEDLNAIWESEKLTFSEKVVESLPADTRRKGPGDAPQQAEGGMGQRGPHPWGGRS